MRKIASYQATAEEDAKDLIKENERKLKEALLEAVSEARLEEKTQTVLELHKMGMSLENIALVTKLAIGQVQQIIDKYQKERD